MVSIEVHAELTPPESPELDEADASGNSDIDVVEQDSAAQVAAAKRRADNAILRASEDDDCKLQESGRATKLKGKSEAKKIIDKARDYQQELFELAQLSNVIAVLDTGSGKTLIACLLIEWMAKQELLDRDNGKPPRLALFLVNSVSPCRTIQQCHAHRDRCI